MRNAHVVKRFGFGPSRGWIILFVIIAALVAGAFWIGPFRPRPPELKLLALSGDGRFHEYVGIPTAWADTLSPASEATARFPLILAVHNAGSRVARPSELALSVPARYRVTDSEGIPLQSTTVVGNPLVRYELPLSTDPIAPGQLPTMITGNDTLWLEAIVPSIYCTMLGDSVPEFVPAPQQNAELMSRLRIFYSFTGGTRQRQTGLLHVQVDSNLVARAPAATPPTFPTERFAPAAPMPVLESLVQVGDRITRCGDPGKPLELHSSLWETPAGARFIVLYNGGVPRKYLFDMNRDSIIELEMWDANADGKFESRRQARMAIPAFLLPFPVAVEDTMQVDSAQLALDSISNTPAWQQLFHDTTAGPLRFSGIRRAAPPAAAAAGTDSARVPAPATAPAPAPARGRAPLFTPPGLDTVRVDPAWVGIFNNSAAGPLRFYRAQRGETIAPAPPPRPRPTRPSGPRLLGVPVDSARRR
jgi:hypothetical protein